MVRVVDGLQVIQDLHTRHRAVEVEVLDHVQEAILLGQVDLRGAVQVLQVEAQNIRIANLALAPALLPFRDVEALQAF